jgi:hypothetical protein
MQAFEETAPVAVIRNSLHSTFAPQFSCDCPASFGVLKRI